RIDQSGDGVGVESALIQPAADEQCRSGAHAEAGALIEARLDAARVFVRGHAGVVPVEVEPYLSRVAAEDAGRVPRGRPLGLAFVDLLVLRPELPLLVGAGGRVRREP